MPSLFDPLHVGDLRLPNRVIMAPLTRCRAGEGRVPNALMAEYYAQRATAGLILTEATSVDPTGVGYPDTPGIWSAGQVAGWKLVTEAVHARGGRIFLQLWHVGRISHPVYLGGKLPVAPSAVRPEGHVSLLRPKRPFETPRALGAPSGRRGTSACCGRSGRSRPRGRWGWTKSPRSSRRTGGGPRTRRRRASTGSRSTAPTATCPTSSSRTGPTAAGTVTAGLLRTAPGSCSK
jgi:hypothetical protein